MKRLPKTQWRLAAMAAILVGIVTAGSSIRGATQPAAPSRTVTGETAPAIVHELGRKIRLEPDGRFTETSNARVTIRHQSAIQFWGQISVSYLKDRDTVTFRRMVVEKADGSRVDVDVSRLEDAPTPTSGAFDAPSYNDTRIKQLTVPSLTVGDTLAYEAVRTRTTPFAANHFWEDHSFQRFMIVERELFEIDHPDTVDIAVKLRTGLDVTETVERSGGRHRRTWSRRQNEVREWTAAELTERVSRAMRGRADPPDVQASTFQTWNQVAAWFADLNATAEHPTDGVRARALMLADTDPRQSLRALHRLVALEIRYVSLAFGEGRYQPRPAELTLSSAYGDCKDKHALLAALGKELKFEIRPVLINSSRTLDEDFPSPGQFDHVISHVRQPDGSEMWLDATADVARPGSLFQSLRGKRALLVAGDRTGVLVTTPSEVGEPQLTRVEISGEYNIDGKYRVAVRREAQGDAEMIMRLGVRDVAEPDRINMAKALAKHDGFGDGMTVRAVTMSDPRDLTTRFWIRYEVESDYESPLKRERWTFWLPTPDLVPAFDDDLQTLDLGAPAQVELKATFALPKQLAITAPVGVSLDDDIGSYRSQYEVRDGVISINRSFATKVDHLAADRIAAYRSLRRSAAADYHQQFTIAAVAASEMTEIGTGPDLVAAGNKALQRRDWPRAVALLQDAVKAQPDHKQAWNSLGRALHEQERWQEAIDAYNQQVRVNRFDEHAYRNRGLAQWRAGRLKEAEASMRQQLEVSPLNASALTSLGQLLLEQKEPAAAIEPLEKAVSLAAEDAWAQLALARAYAATGQSANALASFERTVTIAPNPAMWNNAAWFMAENDLALDKAFEYAQSAATTAAAGTLLFSVDKPAVRQLGMTSSLAAYWDTLGWVHFKRGQIADALRYVRASWQVRQDATVGEHLGRIYEKLGRPREAFAIYRTSLSLRDPSDWLRIRTRQLAQSLKPPPQTEDSITLSLQARTIRLKAGAGVKTAEVMLVVDAKGIISAAKAVSPDAPATVAQALVSTRMPVDAPDAVPFKLVARGVVSCVDARPPCSLLLFLPHEAIKRAGPD